MAPSPLDYPLDYRAVVQAYPGQIRQLEWSSLVIYLYIVQTDTKDIVVNANKSDRISLLNLRPEEIRSVLSQIHGIGTTADIKLLDTYDTYYISRKRNLELPVWKVSIQDVDNSCYYINPRNGQYRYVIPRLVGTIGCIRHCIA